MSPKIYQLYYHPTWFYFSLKFVDSRFLNTAQVISSRLFKKKMALQQNFCDEFSTDLNS